MLLFELLNLLTTLQPKGTDVGKHWHLFVPGLVNLAENHQTSVKVRGLDTISLFLEKCPSSTVYASGIDKLFENTILPTFLLLPTLTPEKDSIMLLRLGYQAALTLATVSKDSHNSNRRRLLDVIVRDGILAGYHHAQNYVRITDVLMQNMAKVVACLGVCSIKHISVRILSSSASNRSH
jgi:hypothetical protein